MITYSLPKAKNYPDNIPFADVNDEYGNTVKIGVAKSVLIAEDNQMHSELMKLIIDSTINANVVIAKDGSEALDRISSEDCFDLIILDIMMPKVNGLDVLKEVRKLYDRVPVLMVSALGDRKTFGMGMALGASDCLAKPISKDIFKQKINFLLGIVQ